MGVPCGNGHQAGFADYRDNAGFSAGASTKGQSRPEGYPCRAGVLVLVDRPSVTAGSTAEKYSNQHGNQQTSVDATTRTGARSSSADRTAEGPGARRLRKVADSLTKANSR
jgi:hypothetical protein